MLFRPLVDASVSDFLHDSFLQFIFNMAAVLLVGIGTVLVAIWIYFKQRSRKSLSYQVLSYAPIALVNKDFKDRVEIRFDDKPIHDLGLIVLKIWNAGNVAVRSEDYFETIKLTFAGATIVGSEILQTEPKNLVGQDETKSFIKQEQESLELPAFPLNPKESITLKVLLTGYNGRISRAGRIADGTITEEANLISRVSPRRKRVRRLLGLLLTLLTLIFLAGISYYIPSSVNPVFAWAVSLLTMLITTIMIAIIAVSITFLTLKKRGELVKIEG